MAKLKSKVVEMAKRSEAKKKRAQINKLTKGKGIKADKPLKKLDKSLRRIRKNPGGFAASIVDAGSVVAPASITRAGLKIVGKTDRGKKILGDLQKILKKGNVTPRKTKKGVKTTEGRTKAPLPSAKNPRKRPNPNLRAEYTLKRRRK